MGVHTWVYVKASKLPQSERDIRVQARIAELKQWWGFKYSYDRVVEQCEKFIKHLGKTNVTAKEYADNLLAEYQGYLDEIQRDGWEAWCRQKGGPYRIKRNGEHYVWIECDTPFRCMIANQEFFTKQELLDFVHTLPVDTKKIECWVNDECIVGITPELEKCIDDLYNTYGEENVFIDFG